MRQQMYEAQMQVQICLAFIFVWSVINNCYIIFCAAQANYETEFRA